MGKSKHRGTIPRSVGHAPVRQVILGIRPEDTLVGELLLETLDLPLEYSMLRRVHRALLDQGLQGSFNEVFLVRIQLGPLSGRLQFLGDLKPVANKKGGKEWSRNLSQPLCIESMQLETGQIESMPKPRLVPDFIFAPQQDRVLCLHYHPLLPVSIPLPQFKWEKNSHLPESQFLSVSQTQDAMQVPLGPLYPAPSLLRLSKRHFPCPCSTLFACLDWRRPKCCRCVVCC